jgi:hypothetical protein
MWSHYAAKHTGVVIEFEVDELFPDVPLAEHFREVRYRSSPPIVAGLHADVSSFDAAIELTLTTKALEWAYEEEARIMMPIALLEGQDDHRYRVFDPNGIKRVIVGCLMDTQSSEHQEIEHLADQPRYRHVTFQRAALDGDEYRLRFATRPSA